VSQNEIRAAAIAFVAELSQFGQETVAWADISNWTHQGERIPLVSQQGIFKPKVLDLPISIRTTPPKVGHDRPYDDHYTESGLLGYRYRGTDPHHPDNVLLRACHEQGVNLLHFEGVSTGVYSASLAAIVADNPSALTFEVALFDLDSALTGLMVETSDALQRSYYTAAVRKRVHQTAFRHRVLDAYQIQCAFCRLRHRELLDAAHITGDADGGEPVVSNGIAMCKIHHAAYDVNIIGVRPDLVADVRSDILAEVDGPMLRYGIQDLHGQALIVPTRASERPNAQAVEERYERFLAAS